MLQAISVKRLPCSLSFIFFINGTLANVPHSCQEISLGGADIPFQQVAEIQQMAADLQQLQVEFGGLSSLLAESQAEAEVDVYSQMSFEQFYILIVCILSYLLWFFGFL